MPRPGTAEVLAQAGTLSSFEIGHGAAPGSLTAVDVAREGFAGLLETEPGLGGGG